MSHLTFTNYVMLLNSIFIKIVSVKTALKLKLHSKTTIYDNQCYLQFNEL